MTGSAQMAKTLFRVGTANGNYPRPQVGEMTMTWAIQAIVSSGCMFVPP